MNTGERFTVATIIGPITVAENRPDLAIMLADAIGLRRIVPTPGSSTLSESSVLPTETPTDQPIPAARKRTEEWATCDRYYNRVTDTEACPCGCVVPKGFTP